MSRTKATARAVEDYLERAVKAKGSLKLTTYDPFNRVGSIVIYKGELWSARDTRGSGEGALLRLMNERVFLHAEPLSELDRGPRNITVSQHVLLMQASPKLQGTREAPDDAPTATRLPRPVEPGRERSTAHVGASTVNPRVVPSKPARSRAPSERATVVKVKSPPTTLQPMMSDTSSGVIETSGINSGNPEQPLPTKTWNWRTAWQVAAIVVSGGLITVVSNVLTSASDDPMSKGAVAASDLALVDVLPKQVDTTSSTLKDTASPQVNTNPTAVGTQPNAADVSRGTLPANVVARMRSIHSDSSLGGIDLSKYVYSIGGQFKQCYDWASARAEREALGDVTVSVRLNEEGQVASSVATGGKVRGVNSCVADVARRLPQLMPLPKAANTLHWVVAFETN